MARTVSMYAATVSQEARVMKETVIVRLAATVSGQDLNVTLVSEDCRTE